MSTPRIRILVIDDSAAMRQLLKTILSSDPELEVVGVASDPFVAREKIKSLHPDVLTLDVEMPKMDGLTFLEKLMKGHPMPVVMVSSLTQNGAEVTLRALELGAVDFVSKPSIDTLQGIASCSEEIIAKVKGAAKARVHAGAVRPTVRPIASGSFRLTHQIVAIGASTGGTEAIREVLERLPADAPGTVIVQHMPKGFTASFAERLNSLSALSVKEAEDGDRVLPGHVFIAPGDSHMEIVRSGAEYRVRVFTAPPVNHHRPSVDVLFDSFARAVGQNGVAVMLTGMGGDGAAAMVRVHDAGARTIAQDEASCVVFGMPREAIIRGAVDHVLPLADIANQILRCAESAA